MPNIFISYRRDDAGYIAGMLSERLRKTFGSASVFIDVDAIPLGVDFREHINNAVSQCDIFLAIIGDSWLGGNNQATRRIDEVTDFVRLEIEAALRRQILIVPVLVGRAKMPNENELPEAIRSLAFRNAAELRSGRDMNHHLESLISGLQSHFTALTGNTVTEEQNFPKESAPLSLVRHTEVDFSANRLHSHKLHTGIAFEDEHLASSTAPNKKLAVMMGSIGVVVIVSLLIVLMQREASDSDNQNPTPTTAQQRSSTAQSLLATDFSTSEAIKDKTQPTFVATQLPLVPKSPQTVKPMMESNPSPVVEQAMFQANSSYFKPCAAGTRNVIVASGYTNRKEALAKIQSLRANFSEFGFKLLNTVAKDSENNEQFAILAGHGLDQVEAQALIAKIKSAGIARDAYHTAQTWDADCADESMAR